jgi:TatD DNase family protein
MFDTHAHIHDPAFDADRSLVLARANDAGVRRILTVGTDLADSRRAIETALAHDLDFSLGIHPHEAHDAPGDLAAAFDELVAFAGRPPTALGEMGLDYYYDHSPREEQRRILIAQLRYAREHPLPLIFHQRDAFEDFVGVLRSECAAPILGVVHCFTGDAAQARQLVDEFGLRLGIGGVLTFKNAEALRGAVREVGLAHLILETDAPYLAPVPHRGKRNEPAFVAATASALAEVLGVAPEEVDERTSATAGALFGPV